MGDHSDTKPNIIRIDVINGWCVTRSDMAARLVSEASLIPVELKEPKPYRRPWWLHLLLYLRLVKLRKVA